MGTKAILTLVPKSDNLTPVQRLVTSYFKHTLDELLGASRQQNFARMRHMAFYLERDVFGRSFTEIGQKYNRDTSSVVVAYRYIAERIKAGDARYAEDAKALMTYLEKEEADRRNVLARGEPVGVEQPPLDSTPLPAQAFSAPSADTHRPCLACGSAFTQDLQRQTTQLYERIIQNLQRQVDELQDRLRQGPET